MTLSDWMMGLEENKLASTTNRYNPLVTIGVATYNRLESLKETLKSSESQKYNNIETIIVNDNSSDGTKEFLEMYLNKNLNVRIFNNKKNMGLAYNRNLGIFKGKGEFYTFIDDDDCLVESAIKDYVDKAIDINYKNTIILGNGLNSYNKRGMHSINYFKGNLIDAFKYGLTPPVGAQFYHREMLLSINGYNEKIKSGVDHDLWIRLLRINPGVKFVNSITTITNCKYNDDNRMTKDHKNRYLKIQDALSYWKNDLEIVDKNFPEHFKNSYEYYLYKKAMSKFQFIIYFMFELKGKKKRVAVKHFITSIIRKYIRVIKIRTLIILHKETFTQKVVNTFPSFK